jgi:uncharacterized protein YndB with AHSA1/START domain
MLPATNQGRIRLLTREFTVDINAPVEQVYAYVTDLRRHPEWSNNKMTMIVYGEPVRVGTTFDAEISAFGKESASCRVVKMAKPTKFVYECDNKKSGSWRWTMTLEPIGNGTRLHHQSEGMKTPGWFSVVKGVMFPFVGKKMMTHGLDNIKARVEAGGGKEVAPASPVS